MNAVAPTSARPTGIGPSRRPADDLDREILTWERFGTAVRQLAQQLALSGYTPDLVLAIARGGLPIAGGLAYALGAQAVGTITVDRAAGPDRCLDLPGVHPDGPPRWSPGMRVLVVDDIATTGSTLESAVAAVSATGAQVRTAVLFARPGSCVRPGYWWRETDRRVELPWSALPPVGDAAVRFIDDTATD